MGSWWTSQCPAWRCLGRGSSKRSLGTVQKLAWAVSQPQPPGSSTCSISLWQCQPPLRFLQHFLTDHPYSPWTGDAYTNIWGGSIYVNLYCLHLPPNFFIPEQIVLLSAHGVRPPFFYPYRLAPSATRHPGDTGSTPG